MGPRLQNQVSFKAYEIEELADVYFFRPLGLIAARAARALRLTPTMVTVIAGVVGAAGGALLYDARLALIGFALIIAHSVLDSADGQLARMTGQESELGRLLDGLAGFVTHAAIYVAIIAAVRTSAWLVIAAVVSNLIHAQMYDYHRSSYVRVAIKGDGTRARHPRASGGMVRATDFIRLYEAMEAALAGLHPRVEATIARRSKGGPISAIDRARYRDCFYWPVRGWNLLGDNTRFYAVGVLAWLARLDLFFLFIVIPMNIAFVLLWWCQWRADRRFLPSL